MKIDRVAIALSVLLMVLLIALAFAPELTTLQSAVLAVLSPALLVVHLLEHRFSRRAAHKRRSKVSR